MNPKPEHASTPMSNTSPLYRLSLKHVFLSDWWLAWADGTGLAVSGLESRRGKSMRVFNSAKVSKIDDALTLETVDGVTIQLSGILNWSRTLQNGFPHEVCSHFLNGFPHYWESYGAQPSEKLPKSSAAARNSSVKPNKKSRIVPASLLNLHVTRMRDFVMFQHMNSENLLADLLESLGTSGDFKDNEEIIDPFSDDKMKETQGQKDDLTSGKEKWNNHGLSDIHPSICTANTVNTTRRITRNTTRRITRSMTRSMKARKS